MTPNELIKILKEYDFKKNSVRSFSLKYKITEKTILKYLKEYKIPYNNRKISYEMTRNCLGQYTFKSSHSQSQTISENKNKTQQASQSKGVKNFAEFNKKYEIFFSGNNLQKI